MRIIAIAFLWLTLLAGMARAQEAGAGWLGVELKDLSKEEADALGWETPRGAKLVKPVPGGPAQGAGLVPDDILVSLDGVEIENVKALIEALGKKAAGTDIRLAILRAGREKRLSLKLVARPAQFAAAKPAADALLPMLDTGGHMASVTALTFTPDGKQLISASEDKTVRVWDSGSGKVLRTIRGEAGAGYIGQIETMALSPDGRWLAVAGYMGPFTVAARKQLGTIRLYDFASGTLVALLKGHEDVVHRLAFSRDSRRLISGSFDRTAIIWDTGDVPHALYKLQGHRDPVYAVGFTPDGTRVVTGAFDHDLRIWRAADGTLLKTMTGHTDKVLSLAIAPNGLIASGDLSGDILLWDGLTGALLIKIPGQQTWITSLNFSPDSRLLLSATARPSGGGHDCHVYDTASGREIATYRGHDGNIFSTAISPDGKLVASGGFSGDIHFWDLRTAAPRAGAAIRGTGRTIWGAGFSPDGREIGWGYAGSTAVNQSPALEYGLVLPVNASIIGPHALDRKTGASFRRAETVHDNWSLSTRKGGDFGLDAFLEIRQDGKLKASIERGSPNGVRHSAYSFAANGEIVVSGGAGGSLSAYSRDGKKLGDFVGHESDLWAVVPSPDGRYLVSGSGDQTVRLWNLKSRELLVTIFPGVDGEWVMWTPQGFYAASGPGAELIGWQINHGAEHEAEYVTAAQLRQHLNRPDIVSRAIQLASAEAAVREAHGADFKLADLLKKPVPRLRILSPEADSTLKGGFAQVTLELEATPDPVKLIRIQVNGRQIAEKLPEEGAGFAPGKLTFEVPLAKGANKIAIAAVNNTGETPVSVSVSHEGEGDLDRRGTLFIIAIGVDKYQSLGNVCGADGTQSCDLQFAGADARAFAEAMEKSGAPLHSQIVKRVLVNGADAGSAPTAGNVRDALGLLRRTTENDTVMLFVSGHGLNEGPFYRFVPTDAAFDETGLLRESSVVSWYAFQEALTAAKGRRILFLDTCHSGNAIDPKLIGDSFQANIVVYSSARWDQEALEDPALGGGHGLFTYSLVEGVSGKARDAAGEVRAEGLRDFMRARVTALAAKFLHDQEPQYFRARDAENYVLARP
ncbi:MAG: PDZ domain-containing protein [Rhodomicrobium sp.]